MRGFVRGAEAKKDLKLEPKFTSETTADKCPDNPDPMDKSYPSYAPKPKGWSAMLAPCLYVALPSVEDFTADTFQFTPGFYDMHDAKVRVQDALSQYLFAQQNANGEFLVDQETFEYAVKRIAM